MKPNERQITLVIRETNFAFTIEKKIFLKERSLCERTLSASSDL